MRAPLLIALVACLSSSVTAWNPLPSPPHGKTLRDGTRVFGCTLCIDHNPGCKEDLTWFTIKKKRTTSKKYAEAKRICQHCLATQCRRNGQTCATPQYCSSGHCCGTAANGWTQWGAYPLNQCFASACPKPRVVAPTPRPTVKSTRYPTAYPTRFPTAAPTLAPTHQYSTAICNPGFVPTNGEHPIAGRTENYCNHPRHGVVCRKTDGSGHWHAPKGCSKTRGFPFAVHTDSGARCTVSCPCVPPESEEYTLVSTVGIPTKNQNWDTSKQVPYKVNNGVPAKFTRVAYCMKLNNKWVWSSFDSTNANAVGVPTDYKLDSAVKNLNVYSNEARVKTQTGAAGKVEFWDNCYGKNGGNGRLYDHDDAPTSANCYGSMQIHQGTNTVMGFNGWSHGSHCDVTIGSQKNAHGTDGTFLANCNTYANAASEIRTYVKEVTEKVELDLKVEGVFGAAEQLKLKDDIAVLLNVNVRYIQIMVGVERRRLLEAAAQNIRVVVVVPGSKVAKVAAEVAAPKFAQVTKAAVVDVKRNIGGKWVNAAAKGEICKNTICTYVNGRTLVSSKNNDKWHCEKSGTGCACVCHNSLKCTLRHHHVSGYKKSFNHC